MIDRRTLPPLPNRAARIGRIAALGTLCLLASCQAARMPLPDGLAGAERWPVQGRQGWKINERLQFGPYAAVDVKRSWTRGRDHAAGAYERNSREQSYSFSLAEHGADRWLVKCSTSFDRKSVHTPAIDVDLSNRSRLDCALTSRDDSATWLLALRETRERPLEGRLSLDSGKLAGPASTAGLHATATNADPPPDFLVRGTTALAGSLPTPETSGYLIEHHGRPAAAIEVINHGAVVLDATLEAETRSLLSAASAALLLLEELRSVSD